MHCAPVCPSVFCKSPAGVRSRATANASNNLTRRNPDQNRCVVEYEFSSFHDLRHLLPPCLRGPLRYVCDAELGKYRFPLEVAGLRKARASGRVSHRIGITRCRVHRSSAARLRGEGPIRSGRKLSCIQSELIRDRACRAGIGLSELSGRVVYAAKAHPGRSLNNDRDRNRGKGCGIREPQL